MLRILKRYKMPLRSVPKGEKVPGDDMSFSSYPGVIYSGDDFTLTSSGSVLPRILLWKFAGINPLNPNPFKCASIWHPSPFSLYLRHGFHSESEQCILYARVQLLRTVKQFQLVWCNLKFFISIHDNIGSGLTILETTIGNNNKDNWRFVTAENSVLEGIRATVANRFVKLKIKTVKVSSYVRLAKDGQSWTEIFSKHNSGTYNNQWMVINNNLFTPGVGIMHFNHD